ncbi:MAG: N-formylglutamate deformylase [Xanthomonadales bacterium]|nr:N-formylglutamate deformylase [Xanthomonadales bacterium]
MSHAFKFQRSNAPLLVSVPHAGIRLDPGMADQLTATAQALEDTDWYVDRLYSGAGALGAGMLIAQYSRYVIDLNRPPDNAPLYETTVPGLVPEYSFGGAPLYRDGPPGAAEIERRLDHYWRPYHEALAAELARLRSEFGYAILFEAHSIRSEVPALFEGQLPDLNLGSFDGRSCAPGLLAAARRVLGGQDAYSHVTDGRFKGGYITRHYGQPNEGIHALQLEMSQAIYMQEQPPRWDAAKAQPVMTLLGRLLAGLLDWGATHA